jgi:hypothetical protein
MVILNIDTSKEEDIIQGYLMLSSLMQNTEEQPKVSPEEQRRQEIMEAAKKMLETSQQFKPEPMQQPIQPQPIQQPPNASQPTQANIEQQEDW